MNEIAGLTFADWFLRPARELGLSLPGGFLDAGDAEFLPECSVMLAAAVAGDIAASDEGNLVPQVGNLIVHRSGGEKQHLGFLAFLDDLLQQAFIAGPAWRAVFLGFADGVVPKVV